MFLGRLGWSLGCSLKLEPILCLCLIDQKDVREYHTWNDFWEQNGLRHCVRFFPLVAFLLVIFCTSYTPLSKTQNFAELYLFAELVIQHLSCPAWEHLFFITVCSTFSWRIWPSLCTWYKREWSLRSCCASISPSQITSKTRPSGRETKFTYVRCGRISAQSFAAQTRMHNPKRKW